MKTSKAYDYEEVCLVVDSNYVTYEQPEGPLDLSFTLGELKAELPIVLYYDAPEGDRRMEQICESLGVLTAGASGTKIQLPQGSLEKVVDGEDPPGFRLFEAFSPLSTVNTAALKELRAAGNKIVATISVSAEHGRALVNELRFAEAVLIGQTQPLTAHRLESTGITVSRVTLIEEASRTIDAPIIATAASPADICKALVAGADAVLLHFGGPFDDTTDRDLEFAVKSIVDAIRENLTELCVACGATNVTGLSTRCYLTPR